MRDMRMIAGSIGLFACMGVAGAHAAGARDAVSPGLSLLCLGQDHRMAPSRSMHAGCLVAQPLPDIEGGQRLRTGTLPIWYAKGAVAGVTYSLDLAWSVRLKGNVYFWLKEDHSPAKPGQGASYPVRISEAMYACGKGEVVALKSWDYDTAGAAHELKARRVAMVGLPVNAMSTLETQCTAAVQAY